MNVERGFKRITLLFSIVAWLGVWLISSFVIYSVWDDERLQYKKCQEDYDNIQWIWNVWDANAWVNGNRDIIQHLLDSQDSYVGASFTRNDKTIHLTTDEVFPVIDKLMLDMSSEVLVETAQSIKLVALKRARENVREHGKWGSSKVSKIVALSAIVGLPIGATGFIVIWLIFFLLRWLIRGFYNDKIPKSDKNKPFVDKKIIKVASRVIALFLLYTLVVVVWIFLTRPSLDYLLNKKQVHKKQVRFATKRPSREEYERSITSITKEQAIAELERRGIWQEEPNKPTFSEFVTKSLFDPNKPNASREYTFEQLEELRRKYFELYEPNTSK